jgi:hypothetical protein
MVNHCNKVPSSDHLYLSTAGGTTADTAVSLCITSTSPFKVGGFKLIA